jgi:lysophospholipase L1-like esterase
MQKEYKPFQIVLFILACLIVLGLITYAVPAGRRDIFGYEFRFLSQNKLLKNEKRHEVNLDSLFVDVDISMVDEVENPHGKVKNFKISDGDLLSYSKNGKDKFAAFFNRLRAGGSDKIRILHYGDSQIEGDRVTAFLRQRLQTQFGGSGPGFIPAVNVYETITFTQTVSENFQRYTNFGGQQLSNKRYGIMNSVGRFTPEFSDSVNLDSLKIITAWMEVEPGFRAYSTAKSYKSITLHYSDAFAGCELKIYNNEELVKTDSLIADGKYHKYKFTLPGAAGKVKFEYSAKMSPNILGYSLDGDGGVQVDNIAMRGSSGTFFGKIDNSLAKQIYDDQNVKLFIMQFGGNSVPYIKDTVDVEQSVSYFKGQLNTIKRLRPNAMIIVIGPSDMSTLIEAEYRTYPLLPLYVDKLRKMTKEIGGAYFDMYAAMGGEDAMVAWVEKGLAGQDYVHFTLKGASIATQKFYDAFMTSYNKLKTTNDSKEN